MLLIPSITAMAIATFLMFYLSPIARNINLVDRPNSRKQHELNVPLTGGIAMMISLVLSLLLFQDSFGQYRILFLCICLVVFTGILDDHRDISARVKFVVKLVVALLLVLLDELVIHSLGEILFVPRPYGLGITAIPFTVIAIVGVINAFNMMDGHDGLAGVIAIIGFASLALLVVINGRGQSLLLISLMISVLAAFVLFNLSFIVGRQRQVFMGDAGSMFIGLVMVFLLIDLSTDGSKTLKTTSAAWVIGLPLLDMMSVFILRIANRRSPLSADRLHIHHFLLNLGLGKYTVLLVLVAVQVLFSTIGVLGSLYYWQDGVLFWSMFMILILYLLVNRVVHYNMRR